jgi:hypothetical protein
MISRTTWKRPPQEQGSTVEANAPCASRVPSGDRPPGSPRRFAASLTARTKSRSARELNQRQAPQPPQRACQTNSLPHEASGSSSVFGRVQPGQATSIEKRVMALIFLL